LITMKNEGYNFRRGLYVIGTLVLSLWLIEAVEYLLDADFRELGIYPRTLKGSIGIITSPLIHDDLYHLSSNSFPLLFLGVSILTVMYLGTGVLVWIGAREAFHIGASGLVYAMIGFLLFGGVFRKDPQSMAISLAFLFLYGGVLQGVFPDAVKNNVSWESHLIGLLVGFVCAFYYRNNSETDQPIDIEENKRPVDTINFTGDADYRYMYEDKG